ncbi:MAG: VOC family protein [Halorhabdus sp.]
MDVTGLDHLVLTVADVERALDFYTTVLGGSAETFAGGRRAVSFGDQKINFHPADDIYTPHAERPEPGTGDFCLVVDDSISAVCRTLRKHDVDVIHGPVEKVGALGPMESVYVRDPDGNLVELAQYDAIE